MLCNDCCRSEKTVAQSTGVRAAKRVTSVTQGTSSIVCSRPIQQSTYRRMVGNLVEKSQKFVNRNITSNKNWKSFQSFKKR